MAAMRPSFRLAPPNLAPRERDAFYSRQVERAIEHGIHVTKAGQVMSRPVLVPSSSTQLELLPERPVHAA